MSKRTYEEYIKNGCHPVGYNEPCQSYYFGQVSVDWLLDQIDQLKQQLAEKDKEIERLNDANRYIHDLHNNLYREYQNQTQLAIRELEKVKDWLNEPFDEDGCFKIGGDLIDFIDQQIKDLRGEKYE